MLYYNWICRKLMNTIYRYCLLPGGSGSVGPVWFPALDGQCHGLSGRTAPGCGWTIQSRNWGKFAGQESLK